MHVAAVEVNSSINFDFPVRIQATFEYHSCNFDFYWLSSSRECPTYVKMISYLLCRLNLNRFA